METIYEIDTIKIEKEKAMQRYRKFRKIANVIRTLEISIAITLISFAISWTSSCIPTVLEFSGVVFRRLSTIFFSPHFVFVIGNVIVITLFANSSPSNADNSGEYSPEKADVEVNVESAVGVPVVEVPAAAVVTVEDREVVQEKVYRRTQSAAIVVEVVEKRELRRSATVPRRKVGKDEVQATKMETKDDPRMRNNDKEDDLSNEEFNRRVEEFIEKQRKFLSEESKILVLSN